jgi:hypothetical protein
MSLTPPVHKKTMPVKIRAKRQTDVEGKKSLGTDGNANLMMISSPSAFLSHHLP